MTRVLLVYPDSRRELIGWGDLGAIAEPLALEYVAAAVMQSGHEARILDLRLHKGELEATVRDWRPDVVGFTGYSMHVLRNLELCAEVRTIDPTCRTAIGGHHATLMPEDFFEPTVDHVVVGDGTVSFPQLLAMIKAYDPEKPVPGIWTRGADGVFRSGGEPPAIDLARMPWPNRVLTADDRDRYHIDWMRPIGLVRTTVGCPFRCSFCSLWQIMDGKYLRRDVAEVAAEIAAVPERYVFLVDDEPFVDVRRMHRLAQQIEDSGIDKEYFSYCRIDSFLRDRDLMKRWRRIGLRRVFFGIESIVDAELAAYHKRQRRSQIVEALQAAREMGIGTMSNFIVSPDYGLNQFVELVDFIRENDVDYPTFTILTPIPGTEAGARFEDFTHRQPNGRPRWDLFDLQHPITPTKLELAEFMRQYELLHRVFARHYRVGQEPPVGDRKQSRSQ